MPLYDYLFGDDTPQKPATEGTVSGYSVLSLPLSQFLANTFPVWGAFIVPESIRLVRRGGEGRQFVVFNTSQPLSRVTRTTIGMSVANTSPTEYYGWAMRLEVATALGLYNASTAVAVAPTEGDLTQERSRARAASELIDKMRKEDAARLSPAGIVDDLAAGVGRFGAGVVNTAGRAFGKGVGSFVGSLGPYGAAALAVGVVAGVSYLVFNLRGIKQRADVATKLL